ncbi:MAG: TatD family hydrolase [Candidatus Thiodiazotropha sp.]
MEELCGMVPSDRDYAVKLTGGVVVFCDPPTYPTREEAQILQQSGFHIAIGMHPKQASLYTDADHAAFLERLSFPGVRVFGEIGVDYSVEPARWANQHVLLDKVLKHLQPFHVLVLHARAIQGDQTGVGYIQLLFQLKGVVPTTQKIHLHCFEGTTEVMNRWTEEFPNTYFGFTGLVGSFNTASKEALRSLNPDRLLLETDAPYFHIGGRRYSSPGLIGMVAKMIADIRKETWSHVLEAASRNARRLYEDTQ